MSLTTCARIGQDLITWLTNATPEQRAALCDALDCNADVLELLNCAGAPIASGDQVPTCEELQQAIAAISFNMASSPTVSVTGNGSAGQPFTPSLVISPQAGNQLSASADGAFVPAELPAGGNPGDVLSKDDNGDITWSAQQGLKYWTESQVTGARTVSTFEPKTDADHADARILPKGDGALTTSNTSTTLARGKESNDLQRRATSGRGSRGYLAVIGGGYNNDIATNAAAAAIVGGQNNSITAGSGFIGAGSQLMVRRNYGTAVGTRGRTTDATTTVGTDFVVASGLSGLLDLPKRDNRWMQYRVSMESSQKTVTYIRFLPEAFIARVRTRVMLSPYLDIPATDTLANVTIADVYEATIDYIVIRRAEGQAVEILGQPKVEVSIPGKTGVTPTLTSAGADLMLKLNGIVEPEASTFRIDQSSEIFETFMATNQ